MEQENNRYVHLARVVVEADTPIAIGTGREDIVTDAPVVRDVNGLPYIPATSLTGVIRHALGIGKEDKNVVFGYHDKNGGQGSRLILTDAVMIGKEGKAMDGICNIQNDEFYSHYNEKNVRQHVRITDKGVADTKGYGKFDNEVVYKGTRFVFEMELLSDETEVEDFENSLKQLYDETFRIGGGTRCGYGKLKVKKREQVTLDMMDAKDRGAYLKKSSSLSSPWEFKNAREFEKGRISASTGWTKYELKLEPRDFMLFGSGMGDEEADNTPMTDIVVEWNDQGKPCFSKQKTLIPATSVKGALAHRTAYHFNKRKGIFAENLKSKEERNKYVGGCNDAVQALFGASVDDVANKRGKRGNVILSDVIHHEVETKVFHHNKIDYFTGGTIDGALFQEKSIWGKGKSYELEILVDNKALADEDVKWAFEQSLKDLCKGLLPLGGVTGRGNGVFGGKLYKNGELWNI